MYLEYRCTQSSSRSRYCLVEVGGWSNYTLQELSLQLRNSWLSFFLAGQLDLWMEFKKFESFFFTLCIENSTSKYFKFKKKTPPFQSITNTEIQHKQQCHYRLASHQYMEFLSIVFFAEENNPIVCWFTFPSLRSQKNSRHQKYTARLMQVLHKT